MSTISMKDLPMEERPYERLARLGAKALSDAELLAILLRCGRKGESALDLARRILTECSDREESALHVLLNLPQGKLEQFDGIGFVKATQILTMGEIARRICEVPSRKAPQMCSPEEIGRVYIPRMRDLVREELHLLAMDTRLQLLSDRLLSVGSVNQALFSCRELFLEALNASAVQVILLHNHPSGDPAPSSADVEATREAVRCGIMLGIPVLDHIIIGFDTYYSMREHEDIFE